MPISTVKTVEGSSGILRLHGLQTPLKHRITNFDDAFKIALVANKITKFMAKSSQNRRKCYLRSN